MKQSSRILLKDLKEAMEMHQDSELATAMAKYMKNNFEFLGIKQPLRKELSKDFKKSVSGLEAKEIREITAELWKLAPREYQYIALEILYASRKKWDKEFPPLFEWLVDTKAWWDSIDFIATKLFGTYYAGIGRPPQMVDWSGSDQLWRNRVAILFQHNYKDQTDWELMVEIIERLKPRKDFFIQKAIGWILRQYYRTNPVRVKKYVQGAKLSGLANREALKHD